MDNIYAGGEQCVHSSECHYQRFHCNGHTVTRHFIEVVLSSEVELFKKLKVVLFCMQEPPPPPPPPQPLANLQLLVFFQKKAAWQHISLSPPKPLTISTPCDDPHAIRTSYIQTGPSKPYNIKMPGIS